MEVGYVNRFFFFSPLPMWGGGRGERDYEYSKKYR